MGSMKFVQDQLWQLRSKKFNCQKFISELFETNFHCFISHVSLQYLLRTIINISYIRSERNRHVKYSFGIFITQLGPKFLSLIGVNIIFIYRFQAQANVNVGNVNVFRDPPKARKSQDNGASAITFLVRNRMVSYVPEMVRN